MGRTKERTNERKRQIKSTQELSSGEKAKKARVCDEQLEQEGGKERRRKEWESRLSGW